MNLKKLQKLCGLGLRRKLVKPWMEQKPQNEEETDMLINQGTGTVCLTLCLASPSKSLEISSGKQNRHLCTNLSTPIRNHLTPIRNHHSLKENRHKILQTKVPTSKETDNIREENFRSVLITLKR